MVKEAIERVNAEGISKITLIAFKQNLAGNIFGRVKTGSKIRI